MVISFKVSTTGRRFQPKPPPREAAAFQVEDEEPDENENPASKKKRDAVSLSTPKSKGEASENNGNGAISDNEVSFMLSLFPDGYSITKPMENEAGHQTPIDVPKFLHPYDRASETLFSAIECGRLPADILDDIPCKYVDGTVVCEVRDYRKCFSEGINAASQDGLPFINRVNLRMSLENIVKDIPSISDNDWGYGDLMELESRILKALQPQLCLDPTPQLDRLSENPVSDKLNLEIRSMRVKRLRQIPEVSVTSSNIHGKKVCVDRVVENLRLGDAGSLIQQPASENLNAQNNVSSTILPLRSNNFVSDSSILTSHLVSHQPGYQIGVGSPRMIKDQRSGNVLNASVSSPGGQDMIIPCADNSAASSHGKRDNQDGQPSPLTNKRARLAHTGSDGNLQQLGQQVDNSYGSDLHWKNTLMQHHSIGRGIIYANSGMPKFSQMFEGGLNQEGGQNPFAMGQQGMRHSLKEEPVETERLDKSEFTNIDSQQSQLQLRMPHQYMRSSFPQNPWNNLGQALDANSRKEEKRKLVQSPRVSAGGLPQSPLSSKSGEFSSGSIGAQLGAAVNSGHISSQKEKSAVKAVSSAVGISVKPAFASSPNDSMHRQNHVQAAPKRRSGSLPKMPAVGGVGAPSSVSTMSIPINASSPPVGTQPLGDQNMLERFSKIERVMVDRRSKYSPKKNKIADYCIRKNFSNQLLEACLNSDSNTENLKDQTCKMPLSKSLVGGNMNVCKTRILNFVQTERIIQGNSFQIVPKARTRMIMSEKPNDGAVAFHIGEIEDAEYVATEDYLPTLPNTNMADLLAAQFCLLMLREGYHMEDRIQPKPGTMNHVPVSQPNGPGIPPAPAMQNFPEGLSNQVSYDIAKPGTSGNAPLNSSSQNGTCPSILNPQAMQMSQGLLPGVSVPFRPQQHEQLQPLQQQPQQHFQFQGSSMMLPSNSMQHLNNVAQNVNMQLGPHMMNKPSSLQLQLMQQQQPSQSLQQQQQHQQRKMMSGLGNVGMGNIGNNVVGLGGLGNVMGIGGVRGVGGTGISSPMGPIGTLNQNPINNLSSAASLNTAIRSGALTREQAAAYMKMRLGHNRANVLGNPQSSIGGISGARQMHPGSTTLSVLGSGLNRANLNPMPHTAMGQMGPPKLMPGMNLYMNQQQQQQHQFQQQQQQFLQQQQQFQQQQQQFQQQQQPIQLQQQQLMQQQQETSPPLQAVVSPPPVSSPSCMGIAHQMNQPNQQQQQQLSPLQISQRTPMSPQLSSGAIHPMTAGNPEACPASPQLSSQTLGSVGSVTNSPMELQGVTKSNSANNV